jgi:UDP-N-acetylmuramoyl-tripeptide--D-alanyl-D-alanine ligase
MNPLPLETIAKFAGGTLSRGGDRVAHGVSTDSRSIEPGAVFVALRGENFDGHRYVGTAARAGAVGAMVERGFKPGPDVTELPCIEVDDTLAGYQALAAAYRRSLSLRVVGITGSNGKTSTKDFVGAVLERGFRVLKTEANFNNHIGVPRMLLRAGSADQIAVLEMGMNHPGEIAPLARMAAPEVGIITNIGSAHIEFMGSSAAIAQEKGDLVAAVPSDGLVVLAAEDEFTPLITARSKAPVRLVGLGAGEIRAENIVDEMGGCRFEVASSDGQRARASLPIPGRHMVQNSLFAFAAGLHFGLSLADCAAALGEVAITKSRLQRREVGGLQFLDDTYNANPESMIAALETLARLPVTGRRIAVLGRMGELGAEALAGHRRVGDAAARLGINHLICVGAEARWIAEGAKARGYTDLTTVDDIAEAARHLRELARAGDLTLVKGSRSAAMETLFEQLTLTATK